MKKELVVIPFKTYNKGTIKYTKALSRKCDSVIYVTLNKTFRSILSQFEEKSIDAAKFFFIDSITPSILTSGQGDRCQFLGSLDDLNKVADNILQVVKHKKADQMIFDSLSSLLVYHSQEKVIQFFNYIIPFMEKLDVDVSLFVMREDVDKAVIKQIEMQVDSISKI